MLQLQGIYETEITGYTSDGHGVARIDGCVVFVPNTIAGERCRVRILHIGKHGATGKIESILEKSPHRVHRACPNAKLCGGCCFWHMDYEEECRLKAQRVRDALQRIGGYDPEEIRVRIRGGFALVRGIGLEITRMNPARLVIAGRIAAVELEVVP